MTVDMKLFPYHMRRRIINAATGMVRRIRMITSIKEYAHSLLSEKAAAAMPMTEPSMNPKSIRTVLLKTEGRSTPSLISLKTAYTVSTGPAIRKGLCMTTAAASQRMRSKTAAMIFFKNGLFKRKIEIV